ncbi:hypothetical protein [Tardiphaga robiniae]|uniref:Uncharacterized protein n=1 Tax=Tardiphaga robiniae TaxID=943830 RepID=A0A7G6TWY8_9BRAD|nr:hypothetical protein [Tardiphaga robiniae]QND71270.1 hypothetical protein HB776_08485 [Tardiphaga robiniae]
MEKSSITPEERREAIAKRERRKENIERKADGLPPLLDPKKAKARARRKERKRRRDRWSEERRHVSKHDGRLKWVKAKKAAGVWVPVEEWKARRIAEENAAYPATEDRLLREREDVRVSMD